MSHLFNDQLLLNLQLFAEGTGGDGGTGANGTMGVNASAADSQQADNSQAADGNNANDVFAEFDALVKDKYKEPFQKRMSDAVIKRTKSSKEIVDKYETLSPALELLSKKYGKDASDINALAQAILDDNSFYEDEAFESNMDVETYKRVMRAEQKNAELQKQLDNINKEAEADRVYNQLIEQTERAKLKYPSIDLMEEVKNPQFNALLKSGIDVETAYTVIHKDDIIPAAMQYTAKQVEQKLANKIIANGSRPTENGINSQASTISTGGGVSQLSKEQRADIIARVQRGDRIVL